MTDKCRNCDGTGWVCESHPGNPWAGVSNHKLACEHGAGAPCPVCNWEMATAGVRTVAYHEGYADGKAGNPVKLGMGNPPS